MNRYLLPIFCLILTSVVTTAYSQETNTNDWHPNTKKLDFIAKHPDPHIGDAGSTLARDIKSFYELLRDKKWHKTYELQAKAFRELNPESGYLASALKYENIWGLVNYEVLSVEFCNSSPDSKDVDEAILICKFTELPDYENSYATVFWHREDGIWKCLSAGPSKLRIFEGAISPPIIDWR